MVKPKKSETVSTQTESILTRSMGTQSSNETTDPSPTNPLMDDNEDLPKLQTPILPEKEESAKDYINSFAATQTDSAAAFMTPTQSNAITNI